jgi:SAM-dependent methyltransferase
MPHLSACPSCREGVLAVFHEKAGVPTNSCILLETRAWPRGDLALAFCPVCGHITNAAFDPQLTEYSARYEETQGFSGTFSAFHRDLARRVIAKHGLAGKTVLEIGCGKGEFLTLLCESGVARGIGFDPAYVPARNTSPAAGRIEFVRDFYDERFTDRRADFVCCKMTLEHIHRTADFVRWSAAPSATVPGPPSSS